MSINHFRAFLSRSWTGIVLTLVSIIAINSMQQVTDSIDWDNSFSIAAAKNLLSGHGYSLAVASPADFSKKHYEPLNKWPPGYSLLLIIMYKLTGEDWLRAIHILNAIGLTAIVLILRRIFFQLAYPAWVINLAILYFGFIMHVFCNIYFSDIFGVLFFFTGLNFLLKYVQSPGKGVVYVIIAASLFSFCAWLKYLYFGAAFIPFICLFFYGYRLKEKTIRFAALSGSFVVAVSVACLILFQVRNSGQAVYISPTTYGFFPEQLLLLNPIVPQSFLNLNFLNVQASLHAGIEYQKMWPVWSIINVGCLLWMAYISWIYLSRHHFSRSNSRDFYVLIAVALSAYLFILLGILTVRISKFYADRVMQITYFQETRYFAIFSLMTFQFAIFLFFKPAGFLKKSAVLVYRVFFILIMLEEILHNGSFIIKQVFERNQFGIRRTSERQLLSAVQIAMHEMEGNKQVITYSSFAPISNFCSLHGTCGIYDLSLLQKPMFSSAPFTLIFVTNRVHGLPDGIRSLIDSTRLIHEDEGIYYYVTHVPKQ